MLERFAVRRNGKPLWQCRVFALLAGLRLAGECDQG
jgi:hypothetical protein